MLWPLSAIPRPGPKYGEVCGSDRLKKAIGVYALCHVDKREKSSIVRS